MTSKPLNLALLQFPLAWESPEDNICFFEKKITQAHSQNSQVDLWVLPEMWSTGFSMNLVKNARTIGANSLSFMIDLALKTQSAVAGSTVFEEDSKVFNRFFFVFPDGTYESYDKRHTFSMAARVRCIKKGLLIRSFNLRDLRSFHKFVMTFAFLVGPETPITTTSCCM